MKNKPLNWVFFLFLALEILSCKKSNTAPSTPKLIANNSKIGGVRKWHGIQSNSCWYCSPPTSYSDSVTDVFGWNPVDSNTIVREGGTQGTPGILKLKASNAAMHTLLFEYTDVNFSNNVGYTETVIYNYENNSITYEYKDDGRYSGTDTYLYTP